MRGAFVLALALIFSSPAQAKEDFNSGNYMLRACDQRDATLDSGICLGRIEAYTSAYRMGYDIIGDPKKAAFCEPDGVILEQQIEVFTSYLRKHPNWRHAGWQFLFLDALNEAWPCPNGPSVVFDVASGGIIITPRK